MAQFNFKVYFFGLMILSGFTCDATSNEIENQYDTNGNVIEGDLAYPHIVIIGATGVGKSSLANAFIGESPLCSNCTFPICTEGSSCTKETTFAVRPWLGEGPEFTVVDTPGFGDTDQDDSVLVDEMMTVLKDVVKSANGLLLVVKGAETRLDAALQQMLREMKALFGDDMWNNIIVGISFWPYSESAIQDRNRTCIYSPEFCHDESWFKSMMMTEIEARFHVGFELPFVFIDSWARHPANIEDLSQQQAFERETELLWEFANGVESFNFKSIQDVLNENQKLKAKVSYLEGVIEDNITELTKDITDLRIKHSQTADTLVTYEGHLTTIDVNMNAHTSLLDSLGLQLADHNQRFVTVESSIQSNTALITGQDATLQSHSGSIANNGQSITDLGIRVQSYQEATDGSINGLQGQLSQVESTALRQCRVCFEVTGNGIATGECLGAFNGCSEFSRWDVQSPVRSPGFIDNTDNADGWCQTQWWVECVAYL